jgi:DNA-binding Lrp family transcriptional regulator
VLMVRAYVLIKIEAGRAEDVLTQLRALRSVRSVDAVTGPVDLIAQVEAEDPLVLSDLIFRFMQTMPGVKETDTRIVVSE